MKLTVTIDRLKIVSEAVQATLAAYIDTRGLFPFYQEQLTASEAYAYVLARGVQEEEFVTDLSALLIEKGAVEAVEAQELATKLVELFKANSVAADDAKSWLLVRIVEDAVSVTDLPALSIALPKTEVVTLADERIIGFPFSEIAASATDVQSMAYVKAINEAVVLNDFLLGFNLNGSQADAALTDDFSGAEDDLGWSLQQTNAEPVAVVETLATAASKPLQELAAVLDAAVVGLVYADATQATTDALAPFQIGLGPVDSALFVETLARNHTRSPITETATANSQGWIVMTDYVDSSYWREDYSTGTYRTFT